MTKLLILLGPPSSGKTTLSKRIVSMYKDGIVIDTSEVLERYGCFDDKGILLRERGLLINDHVVCSAMQAELNMALKKKPEIIIMVGFPRETKDQFFRVEDFIKQGKQFNTHQTLLWHLYYQHEECLSLFLKGSETDRINRPDNDIGVFEKRLKRHVELTLPKINDLLRSQSCPRLTTRSLGETSVVSSTTINSLFMHSASLVEA